MLGIGIDIGSTATKLAVIDGGGDTLFTRQMPTGFSSVDASDRALEELRAAGFDPSDSEVRVVATGYGRIAVPYADKVVTEITCHGVGAVRLFGPEGTVIDVGGQDTKVITLRAGRVAKFAMNDKCAAGTGRFLEIMADRLGVSQEVLSRLAAEGEHRLRGVRGNQHDWPRGASSKHCEWRHGQRVGASRGTRRARFGCSVLPHRRSLRERLFRYPAWREAWGAGHVMPAGKIRGRAWCCRASTCPCWVDKAYSIQA